MTLSVRLDLAPVFVEANPRVRILPAPETGLFTAEAQGFRDADFAETYRAADTEAPIPVTLRYIPYYAFANREECDMLVWVRKK